MLDECKHNPSLIFKFLPEFYSRSPNQFCDALFVMVNAIVARDFLLESNFYFYGMWVNCNAREIKPITRMLELNLS